MKETVVLILIGILLVLASLQTGYILGHWEADEFRKMAYEQKEQIRNVLGRIEILEGPKKK